ncbi:negative regulator for alginate biosynthesis [Parahaliea maris]|uniref:Negative regulator for alginate biosynthesis n=1 Tax=Parahaliea maris TaxID=2716870 RepID=A0A5C9A638_9GAMM|nr:MucB/RseB C-terminal domain-containing protein [Parahaliea maris]TXS95509.1 negative regulator for alginate biosynthesis [Parahaliea maris]
MLTTQARRLCRWLLAAATSLPALTLAASCPGADPEALQWLDRMSRSSHQTAYHGVVTLQRGEDMQVMQISHSVNGDNSSEQLTKLTGQGAQIVRESHPLDCVHTGHRLLQLGSNLGAGECGVAEYYRFEVSKGERIAGRQAVRILVEPLDMYRYGYLMELDSETGLLLKSSTLGRGDLVLERFQFADLSYGSPMPSSADVEVVHEASHPLPDSAMSTADVSGAWAVGWLPRGFVVTDSRSESNGRRTYTDGLAAFSVFLEPLSREIRSGEGIAREGSTLSYTRGLSLDGQPVLVTVIGEVPVNTARMVADSVRWTQ